MHVCTVTSCCKVNMAMQQRRQCLLATVTLLVLSVLLNGAAAASLQGTGEIHTHDSLQEVADLPTEGVTRVCVVPLDDNTRLKVRHVDAQGGKQEVVVKKKYLSLNTLSLLKIKVERDKTNKLTLDVRLNGTQMANRVDAVSLSRPIPTHPRTSLMLKGSAVLKKCTAAEEKSLVEGNEAEPTMLAMSERQDGEKVTEEHEARRVVSSSFRMPPTPSIASVNTTLQTEDPDPDEEPWWSFVMILGKVGEVPVLVLLLACLLVGVALGCALVCLCAKVCQTRRKQAVPLSIRRSGDIVRDTRFWDTLSSRQRSSGIGSAYSTLNTDNGSLMGTTANHGTGTRSVGSVNTSIDRNTRTPVHIGVNNLGRGPNGSPGSLMNQRHKHNSGNTLNIPYGNGVTRSSSNRSTNSLDIRVVDRSPTLGQDNRVARTSSNRSTSSSINRNTNRSPNIPYTKKLGIMAGQQDVPLLGKTNNNNYGGSGGGGGSDSDSDDSNYDKPYISPPVIADNYSVPHKSSEQPVFVELQTHITSNNDPTGRQVPVYQFGTFKK